MFVRFVFFYIKDIAVRALMSIRGRFRF